MIAHETTYRVRYADTDKMGFAHHANYLRWFEVGRSELFRNLGLSYKQIEARGFFLPLSEAYCKFTSPAEYDDLLAIQTRLDLSLKAGIKFDYQVCRKDSQKILATGFTKHACVDRSGQVVRPPDFLVAMIRKNTIQTGSKADAEIDP